MWTNRTIHYATSDAVKWFFFPKDPEGIQSSTFWKRHCRAKNRARIQTPYPKLMIMRHFVGKWMFYQIKTQKQFRLSDDVLEINYQSCCILSGPPCICRSYFISLHESIGVRDQFRLGGGGWGQWARIFSPLLAWISSGFARILIFFFFLARKWLFEKFRGGGGLPPPRTPMHEIIKLCFHKDIDGTAIHFPDNFQHVQGVLLPGLRNNLPDGRCSLKNKCNNIIQNW